MRSSIIICVPCDLIIQRAYYYKNHFYLVPCCPKKFRIFERSIDQFLYVKIQPKTRDLPREALGNNYRVCGVYSPEARAEVSCFNLNFNISKLVYCTDVHVGIEVLNNLHKNTKMIFS